MQEESRVLQDISGYDGMDGMAPRGPRHQQEQLIYTLKQQIDGLDQQTQSLLKDTLYRISRNANAAVSSPPQSVIPTGRMSDACSGMHKPSRGPSFCINFDEEPTDFVCLPFSMPAKTSAEFSFSAENPHTMGKRILFVIMIPHCANPSSVRVLYSIPGNG